MPPYDKREHAHVNTQVVKDGQHTYKKYTHKKNRHATCAACLSQRPKCSTDTGNDILGIMNVSFLGQI